MTLFYTHHDRRYGWTRDFWVGRAIGRLRRTLRRIHRAIAAAKIRRVRNELRLHATTSAKRAHPHRPVPKAQGDRFPRQPLHLDEKWDF